MARKPRIKGRFDVAVYDQFNAVKATLKHKGKMADNACLAMLLGAYTKQEIDVDALIKLLNYTPREVADIDQALAHASADIWAYLHDGLLARCRKLNTYRAQTATPAFSNASDRYQSKTGAWAHIHEVVQAVMAANDQAQHTMEIVYLSPRQVEKLAHSNFPAVQAYFAEHRDEIDAHNQGNEIPSEEAGKSHNLLRAKYLNALRKSPEDGEAFVRHYGYQFARNNGQHQHEGETTENR